MKCYTCSLVNYVTKDYISGYDTDNKILLGSYDPLVVHGNITLNGIIRYVERRHKKLYNRIIDNGEDDKCLLKLVYVDIMNIELKFKDINEQVIYISLDELLGLTKKQKKKIIKMYELDEGSTYKLENIELLRRHRLHAGKNDMVTDYIIIPKNLVISMKDNHNKYRGYIYYKNELNTQLT